MAPEEFVDEWSVDPRDGSVAFGSGYENWAISVPYMQKTGVKFPDIIEYVTTGRTKEIAQKAKINDVIFDMVVRHLPNPHVAQRYRIPNIWKGDTDVRGRHGDGRHGHRRAHLVHGHRHHDGPERGRDRHRAGSSRASLQKGMELAIVGTKIQATASSTSRSSWAPSA